MLTRRPVLVAAIVLLVAAGAGLTGALAPDERLQFVPVLSAIALAWAVRLRDDPRERLAHRPPRLLDAGLLVVGTVLSALTTSLVILVVNSSQLLLHSFIVWGTLFSVGVLALLMRFTTAQSATALLALLQATLFTARYVFEPYGRVIGLIAKDSPPLLAWTVSTAMWVCGLVAFTWSRPKR